MWKRLDTQFLRRRWMIHQFPISTSTSSCIDRIRSRSLVSSTTIGKCDHDQHHHHDHIHIHNQDVRRRPQRRSGTSNLVSSMQFATTRSVRLVPRVMSSFVHPTMTRSSDASFSTTTVVHNSNKNNSSTNSNNNKHDEILLFERPPQYRLLRSGFGFSCFHTAYWIWYCTEFIPLVNASPLQEIHIDPTMGYLGLGLAIAIQTVFFVYPQRLVSKLTLTRTDNQENHHQQQQQQRIQTFSKSSKVAVTSSTPTPTLKRRTNQSTPSIRGHLNIYTHVLPWIRPSSKPSWTFPIVPSSSSKRKNNNNMRSSSPESLLDPASKEAAFILDDLQGRMEDYRGHLVLRPPSYSGAFWIPFGFYLLDFQDESKIPSPNSLFQALLQPELLLLVSSGSSSLAASTNNSNNSNKNNNTGLRRANPAATSNPNDSQLRKIARKRR